MLRAKDIPCCHMEIFLNDVYKSMSIALLVKKPSILRFKSIKNFIAAAQERDMSRALTKNIDFVKVTNHATCSKITSRIIVQERKRQKKFERYFHSCHTKDERKK